MVQNNLEDVKKLFFYKTNLDCSKIKGLIKKIKINKGINIIDFYFQQLHTEKIQFENSYVKNIHNDFDNGIGLRAVSGVNTAYSYTNYFDFEEISKSVDVIKGIYKYNKDIILNKKSYKKNKILLYDNINPIESVTLNEKINCIRNIDSYVRNTNKNVIDVLINLLSTYEIVLLINEEEEFLFDIRPMSYLKLNVIIEKNNRKETGVCGGGGRYDFNDFIINNNKKALEFSDIALSEAENNLLAVPAPAGIMPVVLGNGWPGVLIHEAVGHGLEGDFIRKKSSVYCDKIGKKVASKTCTIVDDGSILKKRGSISIDDEGIPGKKNILIENGILKKYLFDRLNSNFMGEEPTGNGRRESYSCLPIPRMTNTYLMPGKYKEEEIIKSVKNGIFAVNFSGGQVDITSGKFVFSISEAYLINNGKIDRPIKNATLIGDGLEVLNNISMVADNLKFDFGVGTCGKDGQSVPVTVGQPSLKIDKITVGGTNFI